jgi:hypothetical protein
MKQSPSRNYDLLLKKWIQKHRDAQVQMWDKHKAHIDKLSETFIESPRQLAAGSMAGLLLLGQPVPTSLLAQTITDTPADTSAQQQETPQLSPKDKLIQDLKPLLPPAVDPLTEDQEKTISQILSDRFNMHVSPSYEGKRLNRSYGYIGAEQHLMRYPGDTMASHFATSEESQKYYSSGMAPGRGAWGYFAQSLDGMTDKDVEREKWYIAVPTFLSPTWHNDVNTHYKFFRFRKMLVVNPENGKAVIADIGDAGPAPSTGKHLGGSPEVMKHLERVDGRAKGPVLYFFIRDPQDELPLGPVEVQ